jgi:copper homeostasis protein
LKKLNSYLKEACVENLKQALFAEESGADRIELCADLHLDGLSPAQDLILQVKSQLKIPVRVMVRPRGGDFEYSPSEINQMLDSIEFCKKVGVDGVVFGVLKKDKTIDLVAVLELAANARPLNVVFHKAIDDTPDILKSATGLKETGLVNGILTSGGRATALQGAATLKKMMGLVGEDVEIICAGKITSNNIDELHHKIGAKAYHGKKIVSGLT